MNADDGLSSKEATELGVPSLVDISRSALTTSGVLGWTVRDEGGFWVYLEPPAYPLRLQGWKLHVSAVPSSAPTVLMAVMEVLLRHGCAFKFARSLERVQALVSREMDRGSGGKFVTVYPRDDEHFRLLAKDLDEATAGLVGPVILSDRPYRPGSLVHYRYGAFIGYDVLGNDGSYQSMLVAPDGTLIEDKREAWFAPPAWAPSPLPEAAPVKPSQGKSKGILVGNRYVVQGAIRHTNRGGVYQAVDIQTRNPVIIKQGRASTDTSGSGGDSLDLLRREAALLERLATCGIAPAVVELLEIDPYVFLVEELIPGLPLAAWVTEKIAADQLTRSDVMAVAGELVRVLTEVHRVGLVYRDFTATNVIVGSDNRVRIIDLELAADVGTPGIGMGTPGFAPPEVLFAPAGQQPPSTYSVDLYSLGAILFMLVVGAPAGFVEDRPEPRPLRERLVEWLTLAAADSDVVAPLAPLILALMDVDPAQRWDLKRVAAYLTAIERSDDCASVAELDWRSPQLASGQLPDSLADRLIEDGLAYLVATMAPGEPRLWPTTNGFATSTDPLSVQHGAAGTLSVLTSAGQAGVFVHSAMSRMDDARLRDTVRTAAQWIIERLPRERRLLPGLYFGRSGPAWALYEAGRWLGDDAMVGTALSLAKRVPIHWPNPDICHGSAGAGLVQLHLWRATGDEEFLARVRECAHGIVASAEVVGAGVVWPVPTAFDSLFAGTTAHGFAHGAAGMGHFLLAAGLATGEDQFVEVARRAGQTLQAAVLREQDRAYWAQAPGGTERLIHWCNGSSGIGTFLIRLWQATDDDEVGELAAAAARACLRLLAQESPAACHGLAGQGEFLLDMAAATGERRYTDGARQMAAYLYTQAAVRDGLLVPPDESRIEVGPEFSVGLAGAIAFLHRLRHGGTRPFMADTLAFQPEAAQLAVVGGVR